jgi:hypothetical protein
MNQSENATKLYSRSEVERYDSRESTPIIWLTL